jgi:alpha-galactosidase
MKIVLIGAGSRSFGGGMVRDILVCQEFRGLAVTLVLVDVDPEALARMVRFAEKLKSMTGADVTIDSTTDRRAALPGADYVIISVCRERQALWEQDFRVPLANGFRHCLGENGGPGAVFHALRSFELLLPICHDIEALAPSAQVLNFTNPEMRVLHAMLTLTRVKAAGLCHGIGGAISLVAQVMDRPPETFRVTSAGMNHFYAVMKVEDLHTGKDLLPQVKEKVLAQEDCGGPLFRRMLQVFDVLTFPSEDHIGEYLAYGAEFMGVKWHYGQESRKVPIQKPEANRDMLDLLEDPDPPASLFSLGGELCVPIICDIELDRGEFREAVNVLNTRPYIENLPATCCIEVPATVDARGLHPVSVGPLPEPFAEYIRRQATISQVLTEAYRTRQKRLLLQALLLDPVVDSFTAAERVLDEMLDLQRDFLPEFS